MWLITTGDFCLGLGRRLLPRMCFTVYSTDVLQEMLISRKLLNNNKNKARRKDRKETKDRRYIRNTDKMKSSLSRILNLSIRKFLKKEREAERTKKISVILLNYSKIISNNISCLMIKTMYQGMLPVLKCSISSRTLLTTPNSNQSLLNPISTNQSQSIIKPRKRIKISLKPKNPLPKENQISLQTSITTKPKYFSRRTLPMRNGKKHKHHHQGPLREKISVSKER